MINTFKPYILIRNYNFFFMLEKLYFLDFHKVTEKSTLQFWAFSAVKELNWMKKHTNSEFSIFFEFLNHVKLRH